MAFYLHRCRQTVHADYCACQEIVFLILPRDLIAGRGFFYYMNKIKKINKAAEIDEKVKGTTIILDKPEHKEATQVVNEAMGFVRRDYKLKDSNSQASAEGTPLTC